MYKKEYIDYLFAVFNEEIPDDFQYPKDPEWKK